MPENYFCRSHNTWILWEFVSVVKERMCNILAYPPIQDEYSVKLHYIRNFLIFRFATEMFSSMCYHSVMINRLTTKEQSILLFLNEYTKKNGQSPTLAEIAENFRYSSLTSVQRAIVSLEKKGHIKRDKYKKRNITLNTECESKTYPIPVVGLISCGSPILAIENIESYLPTDAKFLKGNPKEYFYLRATGDSMDKADIRNGDLVLVHQQQTAQPNDRVVALIDDQATIKKFVPGNGFIKLMPESHNPVHKPIILRENFTIQGVIVRSFNM